MKPPPPLLDEVVWPVDWVFVVSALLPPPVNLLTKSMVVEGGCLVWLVELKYNGQDTLVV